jgi:succinyl-diaminopimelate desuccinylase
MIALKAAGMKDDFVDFYLDRIGISCDGIGIGLKCSDDYGVLTLNNGIVKTENGKICCTIDIRFPVTMTGEELKNRCAAFMEDERGRIELNSITESLFYPVDSPLVKSLYDAYVCVTGDDKIKPEVMGGGTYAKSIPGIIAFGCKFPNTPDNHIHDANESLDIEELLLQTAIYVKAIENLLAV